MNKADEDRSPYLPVWATGDYKEDQGFRVKSFSPVQYGFNTYHGLFLPSRTEILNWACSFGV